MSQLFEFSPETASTSAARTHHLFIFLFALALVVTLAIAAAIIFFIIKYRRGSQRPRRSLPDSLRLQLLWTSIPLVLTMSLFAWGAQVYLQNSVPPAHAMTIYVVGRQWLWKIQHPEGRREINELHVPLNRDIKLILGSEDVLHDFSIPAFRIQQEVIPGRDTEMWFTATSVGQYPLFCTEYCGPQHGEMNGTVIVMEPSQYEAWLSGGASAAAAAAVTGKDLLQQFGCNSCHPSVAPDFNGLLGRMVKLTDGRTMVADEQYIRRCILTPSKQYVAGYPPIMPSFEGKLNEEQLAKIVDYIKTLKGPAIEGPAPAPVTAPAQK